MGTNTGIGIGIGIPFKNNALGGDRPYLPPELKARLIGVWDNYGKKNTDADRNIIKNKIPNAGGDLEILNAAYEGMSGYNGYPVIFGINKTWKRVPTYNSVYNINDNKIHFTKILSANRGLIFNYVKQNDQLLDKREIPSFKIRISGLEGDSKLRYSYIKTENAVYQSLLDLDNGIHELPKSLAPTDSISNNAWIGFTISPRIENEDSFDCDITIEILPEYEGAFVTDGVSDMIISQKTLQEMGVTKDFTIVSMIHQITLRGATAAALTNYIRQPIGYEYVRNHVANIGKTGIYGYVVYDVNHSSADNSHIINTILGDKNDYSIHITGNLSQGKFSVQGYINGEDNVVETSRVAHYWTFALLGKATEDDINLIIAYFNLDRTLKPDILCNITKQGITNDNHADFNDKLIDYSGNGRDIQMYNLAWKGGSGVAAKKFETIKDYLIFPDEGLQELTIYNEFSYKVKSIKYADRYWTVQSLNKTDVYYPITIIADKDIIWRNTLNYTDENGVKGNIRKETNVPANTPTQVFVLGFNDFDVPDNYTKVNCVAYATRTDITEFTITFIPSCKGGILLDGINDFGKVTGMPIYKDYTFIIDREIISIGDTHGIVASKSEDSTDVNKQGAFLFEYLGAPNNISAWSFYKDNGKVANADFTRGISYQSKYSYNGIELLAGTAFDSDKLWLGILRDRDNRFANVAIYSLMSFPYSMSEFLIERQLKKHKLDMLYPDMVEFRPVINSNVLLDAKPTFVIRGTNTYLNAGDYVPENSQIWVSIKMNNAADRITKFTVNGKTIDIPENAYSEVTLQYGFPFVIDKSPQKIGITIEQDENYVLFNPVITSNVEYHKLDFYLNNYQKRINIGDYIPKGAYLRANFYLKNNVDELTAFIFNGVNIGYKRSSVDDAAFNISYIYNYDSPQEVNITIDEYIRYEDIVQPYPVLLRFNDENGNEVSWGGKFRVGSTITRIGSAADSNLLPNIYNIFGLLLNDNQVTSSKVIVEKTIVFKAKSAYIFDDNEPKCILSPRLLRIPNSSYKILGHIPDISGHGNNGVIHNSAYAEESGVNEDGSYQFDGVDDFVTIPTIVGGEQLLMKVNWSTLNGFIYDQRPASGDKTFGIYTQGDVIAYSQHNNGNTYIDGIINNNIIGNNLSKITHNIVATCDVDNSITPSIGKRSYSNSYFAQMSLYDFMLFDKISTDDKIKELNTYIGITPKVTLPNYYWDNYGKKNTDANKGYIDEQVSLQKTGTSVNPLENFNIGYEGMSGYNGYPVVLGANKTWETSNAVDYIYDINSTIVHITNVKHAANGLLYSYVKKDGALANIKEIPAFRLTVKGLEENSKLIYKYLATENATKESIVYLGNGIHKLPKSFVPTDALLDLTTNSWIGFAITPMIEGELVFDCDITIEILPEYENGLAYDGVSDFTDNKNIPIFTDFTAIIKRVDLDAKNDNSTVMFKGNKIYESSIGNGFILDYCYNSKNYVYSYGKLNQIERDDSKIIYLTPESYNGNPIIKGENEDNLGLVLGKYWKGIIYKTILYSKTISLLEINFLKNLMEKDEIIDINHPIFISNTENESNTSQDT